MEFVERDLVSILLKRVLSLDLISTSAYQAAEDLVRTMVDFPPLFQYPGHLAEEAADAST